MTDQRDADKDEVSELRELVSELRVQLAVAAPYYGYYHRAAESRDRLQALLDPDNEQAVEIAATAVATFLNSVTDTGRVMVMPSDRAKARAILAVLRKAAS